jgi:hypothetical protein
MKPFLGNILTKWPLILLLGILLPLAAACAPSGESTAPALATVIRTESPLQTPSPTIDWFPATATRTPRPTGLPSATPQLLPGLGPQTFQDTFSDPADWLNAKKQGDGGNSIIVANNRLTLAANIPPVFLFTLRPDLLLTDFYAETQVYVNRCEGSDAYGLLFRASGRDYAYRFILNCKNEARLDRVRDAIVFPLSEWTASGDVPIAPGEVKISIWLAGVEMRFFLNDRFQFSVFDPVFKNGSLGMFIDSASPTGMNIGFENLLIRSVDYASPTPTSTPTRTPTPTRTRNP